MAELPDKSIDLILTDLPYGTTSCFWDSIIPFDELWVQYKRLIKKGGAIVLTASQPFTSALIMSNPKWFKCEWIWEKNNCSNFQLAKFQPLKNHESVLVFSEPKIKTNYYPQNLIKVDWTCSNKSKRRNLKHIQINTEEYKQEFTNYPKSIFKFNVERGLHPTQKPVKLLEYLIKTYSKEGDLVLDNCAGSGSTGIACINTNRNYLLMEKDDKFFDIITNRIREYIA